MVRWTWCDWSLILRTYLSLELDTSISQNHSFHVNKAQSQYVAHCLTLLISVACVQDGRRVGLLWHCSDVNRSTAAQRCLLRFVNISYNNTGQMQRWFGDFMGFVSRAFCGISRTPLRKYGVNPLGWEIMTDVPDIRVGNICYYFSQKHAKFSIPAM